jgi:hypothetical protein
MSENESENITLEIIDNETENKIINETSFIEDNHLNEFDIIDQESEPVHEN